MDKTLQTTIELLPRTRTQTIKKFKSIGINTFDDLINFFPSRYEDYSVVSEISRLQPGEVITVIGQIVEVKQLFLRSHMNIQKIILKDHTGKIEISWFNQPYLLTLFKKDVALSVSGLIKQFGSKLTIDPKEYEVITAYDEETVHTGRIIPIYPEKRGLSSHTIRQKIWFTLQNYMKEEFLPPKIIEYNKLMAETQAYQAIHFPKDKSDLERSISRLSFDELFILQLSTLYVRHNWEKEKVSHTYKVTAYKKEIDSFVHCLPYTLTNSQSKVISDIFLDLEKKRPMNRFLQGDVGSGKTVVAAVACYMTYLNGYQSLIMAPTEILAVQHYKTLTSMFIKEFKLKIILLTSATKPNKKELESANIIVGTHALFQKKITYKNVGLVVIDEQHRFGVAQRALLKKKGINPHLLTMTATPIPRTAALTLYGELDLSVIDEMPKGRVPIKTYVVPKIKRLNAYDWIAKKIEENKAQAFIVCPFIEESEHETMKSVRAAKKEYEYLQKTIFPRYSLALLHGKLTSKDKESIMDDFKNKKIDILIATTVVEVGIDIPAATIMMIEAAERYGLAQLHQLRGRVGRGSKESYCLLFTESESRAVQKRLLFFANTMLGMKLAEYDLAQRGAGQIYGLEQHGNSELKLASLFDYELIEKTKKAAGYFYTVYKLSDYSEIQKKLYTLKPEFVAKN